MREFYVQLMSNASTSEFPDNKANSFKNRLPNPLLFESDKEWKVGLSSVSYPHPPPRRFQQLPHRPHLFEDDDKLLEFKWSMESFILTPDGRSIPRPFRNTFTVKGSDLHEDRVKVTSGKSLLRYLVGRYQDRLTHFMENEKETLRTPDGKKYYAVFRWEGDFLIIDNTDTFLNENPSDRVRLRPKIWFGPELVKKLKWVEKPGLGDYRLSHHMIKLFKDDVVPAFKLDWRDQLNVESTNFWNITNDGSLQLSPYCNWRIDYLDELYDQHYGGDVKVSPSIRPPMYLYSNVGRGTITGNRVTDLLREVPHDPDKVTFEPAHIQYKPVRSNVMDILEVQLAENDGKLVDFASGVTSVTLHFKDG